MPSSLVFAMQATGGEDERRRGAEYGNACHGHSPSLLAVAVSSARLPTPSSGAVRGSPPCGINFTRKPTNKRLPTSNNRDAGPSEPSPGRQRSVALLLLVAVGLV